MGPLSGNNDIHAADERIEDLELSGPVTTIALDDPVFMRPSASPVPNVFGLAGIEGSAPYRPFYLGRHYGAMFLSLPAPGSWDDVVFTLTGMGNFTDMSFLARFDTSITVLTYLTIQAYIQGHMGRKGGEFRFGFDEIPFTDPSTGLSMTLPIAYPYQLVDVGVNLRVNF